jgi:putative ABC transport system substrate-binding protein
VAAALPLPARAQGAPVRIPRIGLMDDDPLWDNFRQGLRDLGYVENQNIAIEYRSAENNVDRLAQAARELVALPVDVIVVNGSLAARAAQQATSTIPIVMVMIGDPVRAGFVASLARPGGNMTGYSEISPDLIGKRLALLKECVPALARVAFLWNPDNASNRAIWEALMGAIPTLGLQLISVPIRDADEFDGAFSAMMRGMPNAAVATNDPMIRRNMRQIIDFAATNRLPVIYQTKEFVAAGGLMSYGTDEPSMFRRGASYVHRILQGAKPADLPIEQPTRFELVINLKTAKALGLTTPETLLATADEVIQ